MVSTTQRHRMDRGVPEGARGDVGEAEGEGDLAAVRVRQRVHNERQPCQHESRDVSQATRYKKHQGLGLTVALDRAVDVEELERGQRRLERPLPPDRLEGLGVHRREVCQRAERSGQHLLVAGVRTQRCRDFRHRPFTLHDHHQAHSAIATKKETD